ncbi:uncharacterized protein LOC114477681 [Gouania willdenowi]|uniref:uncharacterized protein LOC114477681 n=1 Tax=Gouania willdenowi TaxID=441366 RepID=UPI0010566BE8|nr:uncharacterized protein LOC114477681 [Gouania willdenowi]
MERKVETKPPIHEDVFVVDLMNAGNFCFSCDQIFQSRKCLEEHSCTSVSFICSCGTEFREYDDMQQHNTTHEPGHQVLDHETIRKRRMENRKKEEEKIKRLQKGEVVWNTSTMEGGSSSTLPMKSLVQVRNTAASDWFPSKSPTCLPPSVVPAMTDMPNIFPGAGPGAPTVDLWTLYQPVVLLNMDSKINKKMPYTCGRCGQSFMKKTELISHHSVHVTDKVSGCIGCGMLLSSKKMVPRFHACNSSNNTTKFKVITARPLNYKAPSGASTDMRANAGAQMLPKTSFLHARKPRAGVRGGRRPVASTLQQNNKNNTGYEVTPTLLFKNRNIGASKPFVASPFHGKTKSLHSTALNHINLGRTAAPSVHIKLPTHSQSGVAGKSSLMSSSSSQGAFTCRVCHFPFESALLLQRHKCSKAKEFMAHHVRFSNQPFQANRVPPVASSSFNQMNGQRKPAPVTKQVTAVSRDKRQGGVPVNGKTDLESDDDCYIVESQPDNPAEMIYQITSSVPIKT